jgi:hypothetical protein
MNLPESKSPRKAHEMALETWRKRVGCVYSTRLLGRAAGEEFGQYSSDIPIFDYLLSENSTNAIDTVSKTLRWNRSIQTKLSNWLATPPVPLLVIEGLRVG